MEILINEPRLVEKKTDGQDNEFKRKYFLNLIGVDENSIMWPKQLKQKTLVPDYRHKTPFSMESMYGDSDLAKLEIFKGGFINFGIWPKLVPNPISLEQRIEASKNIYRELAVLSDIGPQSEVVEIGCGGGCGSKLMVEEFNTKSFIGVDVTPEQVDRSRMNHQDFLSEVGLGRLRFIQGDAMCIPLPDNSFTHVISVEAAQHFKSIERFIKESYRVLRKEGRLVFTTFFASNAEGLEAIKCVFPDYQTHCSSFTSEDVCAIIRSIFGAVTEVDISENVWPGLESWLVNIGFSDQFTILLPALARVGLIKYSYFMATKL